MLEKYLEWVSYGYKIYAKFEKDGMEHVVVSETTPSGSESDLYILYCNGNQIYNNEDTLVAIVKDNEIKLMN